MRMRSQCSAQFTEKKIYKLKSDVQMVMSIKKTTPETVT